MGSTGAPWNIWIPDGTSPVAPLQTLFSTQAVSTAAALDTIAARAAIPTVNTLADLDAIATASIGSVYMMLTPGTGIDALNWQAYAGSGAGIDWRPVGNVVADTKAHLDSFIAAVAAIADTRFEIGAEAFVTGTGLLYFFTSAVGALSTPVGGATTGTPTLSANIANLASYTPKLEKTGNIVTLQFGVTNSGSTPTAIPGAGTSVMTLPVGFRPTANPLVIGYGVNNGGVLTIIYTLDSAGVLKAHPSSGLGGGASLFGAISFSVA